MSNFTWDAANQAYFARHRLANGQFCQIAFYKVYYRNRAVEYHVAFAVADKKKQLNGWFDGTKENNIELKMTGKCGAASLIWAKNMLLAFEDEVYVDKTVSSKIVVMGEDSRRFQLYERALSRYGYTKTRVEDGWAMVKFIDKTSIS